MLMEKWLKFVVAWSRKSFDDVDWTSCNFDLKCEADESRNCRRIVGVTLPRNLCLALFERIIEIFRASFMPFSWSRPSFLSLFTRISRFCDFFFHAGKCWKWFSGVDGFEGSIGAHQLKRFSYYLWNWRWLKWYSGVDGFWRWNRFFHVTCGRYCFLGCSWKCRLCCRFVDCRECVLVLVEFLYPLFSLCL